MLTELRIENFAIIDRLELHLKPGLVTFTGETGAGKSIIIDAVETLLGGRADGAQVRTGAERASIEGVFQIPDSTRSGVIEILEREGLLDDLTSISMGREIRLAGRSIARVNGRSVNASLLRELGEYLVDVHGQSEHLSLLRVNQHLGLLDRFAISNLDDDLPALLDDYQGTYHKLQSIRRELENIRQEERDAARKADMLNYQINEIESAHLQPGEDHELLEERNRLANAESLASLVQEALQTLDEGTPDAPTAIDLLGSATEALASLVRIDQSQASLHESAQGLFENLSDLSRSLRAYLESVEFNPKRLDRVEERLVLIANLKRKYGDNIKAVLDFAKSARNQLDKINNAEERILELENEQIRLMDRLSQKGQAVSEKRHTAARVLEAAIETELNTLHMPDARFQVAFEQQPDDNGVLIGNDQRVAYSVNGLEKIEFLIAPNPGEGLKPLVKIASGGETSRLMLALKNVLAQADNISTLIFDEIDQGIGGRVGMIVGEKLWQLGRGHQVLCVTHLPQLAAYGGQHYHVEKNVHAGRTTTKVKELHEPERLVELAQMLGSVSDASLQSARELLDNVDQRTKI